MKKNVQAEQLRLMPTHGLWASIAPDAAIKVWMSDLSRLLTPPYRPDFWSIVGQGVVIEAEEEADARDLVHHVAGELAMGLHILDCNSVIESFPQWFDSLTDGGPAIVYMGAGPWQGEKFAEKHPSAPYCQYDNEHCRKC